MLRTFFAFLAFLPLYLSCQVTDVNLKINHMLGADNFYLDMPATNNLGHEFTATRLEYYISGITLIEASSMEIPINDTIVALVSPHEEISTVVNLGAFEVSEIIGVRFHIGVPEALNHLDPTLYPEGHALGLHTESMHWSWATGYKFLAYDGTCGTDLTSVFSFHGAWAENYFETGADVISSYDGEMLILEINGDYTEGLKDMNLDDIEDFMIDHGGLASKQVLENWRDYVFGAFTSSRQNNKLEPIQIEVYPNPSQGDITIKLPESTETQSISIYNSIGELIYEFDNLNDNLIELNMPVSGIFFIHLRDVNGAAMTPYKLVIK